MISFTFSQQGAARPLYRIVAGRHVDAVLHVGGVPLAQHLGLVLAQHGRLGIPLLGYAQLSDRMDRVRQRPAVGFATAQGA